MNTPMRDYYNSIKQDIDVAIECLKYISKFIKEEKYIENDILKELSTEEIGLFQNRLDETKIFWRKFIIKEKDSGDKSKTNRGEIIKKSLKRKNEEKKEEEEQPKKKQKINDVNSKSLSNTTDSDDVSSVPLSKPPKKRSKRSSDVVAKSRSTEENRKKSKKNYKVYINKTFSIIFFSIY
jgi:hypothetical protein